jgi:hypothetical protein
MRTFNSIIGSAFCNLACVRELPDQVKSDFDNPPALFKERIKIPGINIHHDFQKSKSTLCENFEIFVGEKVTFVTKSDSHIFRNLKQKTGKFNKEKFRAPKKIKPKRKLSL